jgi:hypothetical protein
VGETHLSLEGYWLLSSLWAQAVTDMLAGRDAPDKSTLPPPRLRRYVQGLQARGNTVEKILYQEGAKYLNAQMPLLAVRSLQEAARGRQPEAQLILARLRQEVGLPVEIPENLETEWVRFDLDNALRGVH